jgi:hypothetical protein
MKKNSFTFLLALTFYSVNAQSTKKSASADTKKDTIVLTPQNGFYYNSNNFAYLDGNILAYQPTQVTPPHTGTVEFHFFEKGTNHSSSHNVSLNLRLWLDLDSLGSKVIKPKQWCAKFDIQTNSASDSNTFYFGIIKAGGGLKSVYHKTIYGALIQTIMVCYPIDSIAKSGIIGMYATKPVYDAVPFFLTSIKLYKD